MDAPDNHAAWAALEAHYAKIRLTALTRPLRRRPGSRRTSQRRRRRRLSRLLEEPHHRRNPRTAAEPRRSSRTCARASTPCSAATRSTFRRTAPCCTWRCARRSAATIMVDGKNVVPEVHEALDKMTRVRRTRSQRRVERPHRQTNSQRRQHRHRRLGSRPRDGLRSAARIQRSRHDVPLRLEHRRHRLRRSGDRSRCGRDAVHHLVEDVHHARDDDQRAHRALVAAGQAAQRRDRDRQALRRRVDQRRGRSRSSASTPPTCSASGIGSAAATRWIRPSGSRRCSRSGREHFKQMLLGFHEMDEHFRTTPFAQNLPVLMGLLARLVQRFLRRADGRRAALRTVPQALSGLSAAAHDGEQRQARAARRRSRSSTMTGPIYWGEPGTNGQHSFYQLIHQGTRLIPMRLHRVHQDAQPARPASRHPDRQRLRARRSAGVRQDARTSEGRGHARLARAAPRVRGQPADEHAAARRTRRRRRSASSSRSTSTPCSCRA